MKKYCIVVCLVMLMLVTVSNYIYGYEIILKASTSYEGKFSSIRSEIDKEVPSNNGISEYELSLHLNEVLDKLKKDIENNVKITNADTYLASMPYELDTYEEYLKDEYDAIISKIKSDIINPYINSYTIGVTNAGYNRPVDPSSNNNQLDNVIAGVDKIWSSIILIVQIVSVACVVIAGVRYMFASADKKADLKKGVMYLMLGAIFVFAASTIIRFIFNIGNSVIK